MPGARTALAMASTLASATSASTTSEASNVKMSAPLSIMPMRKRTSASRYVRMKGSSQSIGNIKVSELQVCSKSTHFIFLFQCSSECTQGCFGPSASDCKACRNYRIYLSSTAPFTNTSKFNCSATCPPELPYKIFPEDGSDPYCGYDPLSFFVYVFILNLPIIVVP